MDADTTRWEFEGSDSIYTQSQSKSHKLLICYQRKNSNVTMGSLAYHLARAIQAGTSDTTGTSTCHFCYKGHHSDKRTWSGWSGQCGLRSGPLQIQSPVLGFWAQCAHLQELSVSPGSGKRWRKNAATTEGSPGTQGEGRSSGLLLKLLCESEIT